MTRPIDPAVAAFAADVERQVRSFRGRWLVVEEEGGASRYTRKSEARSHVRELADFGIPARLMRYRRERVRYADGRLEVTHARWMPRPLYYPGGPTCIADDNTQCDCQRCTAAAEAWEREQGWGDRDRGADDDDYDPDPDDGEREDDGEDWCTCPRSALDRRIHVGPCDWCGKELGR